MASVRRFYFVQKYAIINILTHLISTEEPAMSETITPTTHVLEEEVTHTHDEHLRGVDLSRPKKNKHDLGQVAFDSHLAHYEEDRDSVSVIPAAE